MIRILNLNQHKLNFLFNPLSQSFTKAHQKKGKLHASQIPFDLTPPTSQLKKQAIQSIKTSQKTPTTYNFRQKSSKLSTFLKSKLINKQDQKLTLTNQSNIQTSYYQAQKQKITDNIKTRNFYYHQYKKGQEKLERVPLDPYHQYKMSDYIRRQQEKQQQLRDFKLKKINNVARAESIVKMAQGYDEKQRKGQLQSYLKYLKEYPGSIKGQNAEQDPQAFKKYALDGMPKIIRDRLQHQQLRQAQNNPKLRKEYRKASKQAYDSSSTTSEWLSQNRSQYIPQSEPDMSGVNFIFPYSQIPALPSSKFTEYQDYILKVNAWANFKFYYHQKNMGKNLKKYFDTLQQLSKLKDPQPQQQFYELAPAASSLTAYYKCLPISIQENPAVKVIFKGLQFESPHISLQQKQHYLNYAAQLSLPLDDVTQAIMKQFGKSKKAWVTPQMKDQVFNIDPDYTWQINKFLAEIKQQKLRNASNIQQRTQQYKQPPKIWLHQQINVPSLPVDYYENQDGFWNDHIKRKMKRYDQAQPMLKYRKKFIH